MRYRVAGISLASTEQLPEACLLEDGEAEWSFELLTDDEQRSAAEEGVLVGDRRHGERWLWLIRRDEKYLLRFAETAEFEIDPSTRRIACRPSPGVPLDTIRHLLLDQALPRALSLCGRVVLHASAVVSPRGVIAFLGNTGCGKSTLAASFANGGMPLLADDALVLEEDSRGHLLASPSYPGIRLWRRDVPSLIGPGLEGPRVAHYGDKVRVDQSAGRFDFARQPEPLRTLYLLARAHVAVGGGIAVRRMSPREAMMTLVQHALRLDLAGKQRVSEEFARLSSAAALTRVCELAFPREHAALSRVRESILADLAH